MNYKLGILQQKWLILEKLLLQNNAPELLWKIWECMWKTEWENAMLLCKPLQKPEWVLRLSHQKSAVCTHTVACDLTYMDNIDIIIIRKCFQHFTDRGSDQFKGQSRYTSTPATHQYKHNGSYRESWHKNWKNEICGIASKTKYILTRFITFII